MTTVTRPRNTPEVRLPAAPLIAATGRRHRPAAAILDVATRTVNRWLATGGIPMSTALTLADRIGVHPIEIWGDTYLALPDDPRDHTTWANNLAQIMSCEPEDHQ